MGKLEVLAADIAGATKAAWSPILMGHEDLSTTQRYVRVTGRDLERAMALLKAWRDARDVAGNETNIPLKPARPLP